MNCATPLKGGTGVKTGLLPPNTVLQNRYTIVSRVGHGGMGAVYETQDTRISGKRWAVKELSDADLGTPQEKQDAIAAFRQEARMLALLDHPNLPVVSDFFSEAGKHYLVMEFIDGETLEDKLDNQEGSFDQAEVLSWVDQVCEVLSYLHSQNPPIIFRDLKPSNVMVDKSGRVKLIDFGIARLFKAGKKTDTQAMGTPGYAAPEQYGKGQTDSRSDVYGLGVLLHQLLTRYDPGHTPFNLPPPEKVNPDISPEVAAVIEKATHTKPSDRFQAVSEMRSALNARAPSHTYVTGTVAPVKTVAVTAPQTGTRPRLATGIAWIQILTGLDLLGLIAGVGLLKDKTWGWRLAGIRSWLWFIFGLFLHTMNIVEEGSGYCYYRDNELRCNFWEEEATIFGLILVGVVLFGFCLLYLHHKDIKNYYLPMKIGQGRPRIGVKVAGWIYILLFWGFGVTLQAGIGLLKDKKWGWRYATILGWLLTLAGVVSWIYGWNQGAYAQSRDRSWAMDEAYIYMFIGGLGFVLFFLITLYLHRRDIKESF